MRETEIIVNRQLRDQMSGRYEVLQKVKALLLIPELECMTTQQVSEYYEVGKEAIEAIYTRNSEELLLDGMRLCKRKEFLNLQHESLEMLKGKAVMYFSDGSVLAIPNRGIKVFPRRAILRIGMLLRDSEIAKEVRTQLLNIEDKSSNKVKVADIDEEQHLMFNIGKAYASGVIEEVMRSTAEYNAFQNRHILKLQSDNKALAGEILAWTDRKKLNAGVRKLSAVTGLKFGNLWNDLYKNLQYKYGICLKQRGDKPFIQWVKESEWENVVKTFCAMCEAYEKSPSEMFQQVTPLNTLISRQ